MSPKLGGVEERKSSAGQRLLTVHLTTPVVAGLLLVLQFSILGLVAAPRFGIDIPLVRPLLAVVYLSVVPGFLILRIVGIDPTDVTDTLLYAVGLSLTVLMFYGFAINFVLRAVGYPTPVTEVPMVASILGLTLGLTALYYFRRERPEKLTVPRDDVASPVFTFLLLLPLLGIYGAYTLNVYTENAALLALFAAIAGVLLIVYTETLPQSMLSFAVWMIGLALLWQNTLTGSFMAWGDQVTEAEHVLAVLSNGFWTTTPGDITVRNQYTMLRLTILHPIYVLFTDLELVWVYKIVHPLLFSLTPVALYQGYKRFVTERAAFYSAFFFMSLFSFFIVLSRNTRTGTALFFLGLFVVLLLDDQLADVYRTVLAMLFASSIVVSHYGVSYILLFALGLALPAFLIARRLEGVIDPQGIQSRASVSVASFGFLGFYLTVLLAWYIYASPGGQSFGLVVNFGDHFLTTLAEEFTGYEQSASVRVATADQGSVVIDALRYYHFVLGAIIAIGILGTGLRTIGILDREGSGEVIIENMSREFVIFAVAFLAIFGVTFLPVQRINTARTFAIALIFLAPFLVVGTREIFRTINHVFEISPKKVPVFNVVVLVLLIYFLLNTGVVSAIAINQYSPNALVEKERITEEGQPVEQNYFYKQHPTIHQMEGTVWLRTNSSPNATVYTGNWPGGMRTPIGYSEYRNKQNEYVPIEGKSLETESVGKGYVYLGSFEYRGNVVAYVPGQFGFVFDRRTEVEDKWDNKDRIYHNGESVVRY
jgi:uncharacterized membrane protein